MISENEKILTRHHRFELLDAVRGVAALFVAMFHAPPSMQKLFPTQVNFLAVDLFFCLSGFVIAFSYEERIRRGMTLREFFIIRIIRLYPLYLLGTLAGGFAILGRSYLLPQGHRTGTEFFTTLGFSLLMLPTLFGKFITTNAYPFNGPSWSLFFEIFANLAYAILLIRRAASTGLLFFLALSSLAVSCFYALPDAGSFNVGAGHTQFLLGFPRVGFSFFAGVLLFRLFNNCPNLRVPSKFHGCVGLLLLMVAGGVLGNTASWAAKPIAQFIVIVVVMPALVFVGAGIHVGPRWKKISFALGEFSYPLYILCTPLFTPLYFIQKLQIHGLFYQLLAPINIVLFIPLTRWIALHYDAPVRKSLTQLLATRHLSKREPAS